MSSSRDLSRDVAKMLNQFGSRAQEIGMSPQELAMHLTEKAEILFANEFELISGDGAMTNGSQRRMKNPPAAMPKARMAKSRGRVSQSDGNFDCEEPQESLPKCIESFARWSECVLEMGRYAKDELSYGDLASSTLADHQSYVKWVLHNPKKAPNPRYLDLMQFLELYQELTGHGSVLGECFLGSDVPRRFKK